MLFGCAFNVISMTKKSTLFRCTFSEVLLIDGRSKSFKCTYFAIILTDWKLAQLWHAYYVFLQDKNSWSFWYLFSKSFRFIKTENYFDIFFWCSFVLTYFFNVISCQLIIFFGEEFKDIHTSLEIVRRGIRLQ